MSEKKIYLVSELAESVGVARTTINDWLSRYAPYLDFELRGKRKGYSENAVAVLKEIAELRNLGKSAFDIEKELEKRHGIRAEVTEKAAPTAPETAKVTESPVETLPAPVVPMQEMTALMHGQFEDLLHRIEEEQQDRRKRMRRTFWGGLVLLLILILLAAGGFFLTVKLLDSIRRESAEESRKVTDRLRQTETQLAAAEEDRARAFDSLADLQKKSQGELERQLDRQTQQFTKMIEDLRKNEADRYEAKMVELRNEFAKNQQRYLTELESLRTVDQAARKAEIDRIEAEFARKQQAFQEELAKAKEEQQRLQAELTARSTPPPVTLPVTSPVEGAAQ